MRANYVSSIRAARSRRPPSERRGVAAVEFAIVAPIFFLMVFGMIEYGRMVMVKQMLTNAVREGARIGVLDGSTTEQATAAVTNYLASGAIEGATIVVNPSPPSAAGYGSPVIVTASIPFDEVSWMPTPFFLGGKTITAVAVMRRETPQ